MQSQMNSLPAQADPYFLVSKRLGFRHWTAKDLPLAIALWGDPEVVGRFLNGPWPPSHCKKQLQLEMQTQRKFGYQLWPIFELETGRHAGCAGFRPPFNGEPDVLELGIMLPRPFWRGSYSDEAIHRLFDYGFYELHARAITAKHHPDHRVSKALILRHGLKFTHMEPLWPTEHEPPLHRAWNTIAKPLGLRRLSQRQPTQSLGPSYRVDAPA